MAKTVLIAEESKMVSTLLTKLIEENYANVNVKHVLNSKDLKAAIEKSSPSIIFYGKTKNEARPFWAEHKLPLTPTILLVEDDDQDLASWSDKAWLHALVTKPFSYNEIAAAIGKLLPIQKSKQHRSNLDSFKVLDSELIDLLSSKEVKGDNVLEILDSKLNPAFDKYIAPAAASAAVIKNSQEELFNLSNQNQASKELDEELFIDLNTKDDKEPAIQPAEQVKLAPDANENIGYDTDFAFDTDEQSDAYDSYEKVISNFSVDDQIRGDSVELSTAEASPPEELLDGGMTMKNLNNQSENSDSLDALEESSQESDMAAGGEHGLGKEEIDKLFQPFVEEENEGEELSEAELSSAMTADQLFSDLSADDDPGSAKNVIELVDNAEAAEENASGLLNFSTEDSSDIESMHHGQSEDEEPLVPAKDDKALGSNFSAKADAISSLFDETFSSFDEISLKDSAAEHSAEQSADSTLDEDHGYSSRNEQFSNGSKIDEQDEFDQQPSTASKQSSNQYDLPIIPDEPPARKKIADELSIDDTLKLFVDSQSEASEIEDAKELFVSMNKNYSTDKSILDSVIDDHEDADIAASSSNEDSEDSALFEISEDNLDFEKSAAGDTELDLHSFATNLDQSDHSSIDSEQELEKKDVLHSIDDDNLFSTSDFGAELEDSESRAKSPSAAEHSDQSELDADSARMFAEVTSDSHKNEGFSEEAIDKMFLESSGLLDPENKLPIRSDELKEGAPENGVDEASSNYDNDLDSSLFAVSEFSDDLEFSESTTKESLGAEDDADSTTEFDVEAKTANDDDIFATDDDLLDRPSDSAASAKEAELDAESARMLAEVTSESHKNNGLEEDAIDKKFIESAGLHEDLPKTRANKNLEDELFSIDEEDDSLSDHHSQADFTTMAESVDYSNAHKPKLGISDADKLSAEFLSLEPPAFQDSQDSQGKSNSNDEVSDEDVESMISDLADIINVNGDGIKNVVDKTNNHVASSNQHHDLDDQKPNSNELLAVIDGFSDHQDQSSADLENYFENEQSKLQNKSDTSAENEVNLAFSKNDLSMLVDKGAGQARFTEDNDDFISDINNSDAPILTKSFAIKKIQAAIKKGLVSQDDIDKKLQEIESHIRISEDHSKQSRELFLKIKDWDN